MKDYLDSQLYQLIHNNLPIVCVDVVIKTPDNGFLMVKRKEEPAKGEWWLVGGRVFKNESLVSAAKRKVFEETSLTIESLEKIVDGYELFFDKDPFNHNNGTHTVSTCFLSDVRNQSAIRLDKYHSKFKVFSHYNEDWHPYLKNCFKNAGFISISVGPFL